MLPLQRDQGRALGEAGRALNARQGNMVHLWMRFCVHAPCSMFDQLRLLRFRGVPVCALLLRRLPIRTRNTDGAGHKQRRTTATHTKPRIRGVSDPSRQRRRLEACRHPCGSWAVCLPSVHASADASLSGICAALAL